MKATLDAIVATVPSDWPTWMFAGLVGTVALVLVALLVGFLIRRRKRSPQAENASQDGPISKAYDGYGGIVDHPYGVPAIALIGTAKSDLDALANSLDLASFGGERPLVRRIHGSRAILTREGQVHLADADIWQSGDWGRRWRQIVEGLVAQRPLRPLDGIVVAVSADELIDAGQERSDRLAMLGEQIAETVAMIERHGAMLVPLYLVLTHGECVAGFDVFRQSMQDCGLDRPLGWAASGDLAVFGRRLGDRRLTDMLDEALTALQLELMRAQPIQASGLVTFAAAVESLADPLGRLMAASLRHSAYHQPILWRGFWLTGRSEDERRSNLAFAKELFARKIFREYRLAVPSRQMIGRRGKQIRWAQVACATLAGLACLGLWHLSGEKARLASVNQLMGQVSEQIKLAGDAPERDRRAGTGAVRLAALNLLNAMANLSVTSLSTVVAPTSLMSNADLRVEMAIGRAYDQVVLRAVGGRLVSMTSELIEPVGEEATAAEELEELVGQIEDFADKLLVFSNLRQNGEIADLAEVADFALGIELPPDFNENYHLYGQALSYTRTPELDLVSIRQSLQLALEGAFTQAAEQYFGATQLEKAIHDLLRVLGIGRRGQAGDREAAIAALQATRRDILDIEQALNGPNYSWLVNPSQPAEGPFFELISRLDDLPTFGRDRLVGIKAQERLVQTVDIIRQEAAERLLAYRYSKGMILELHNQRVVASPALLNARTEIERIEAELGGFDGGREVFPNGARQRIHWHIELLEDTMRLLERYRHYRDTAGRDLPDELTSMLEKFAQARMFSAVLRAIDRTSPASIAPAGLNDRLSDGPDREELALSVAAPVLVELLQDLRRARMSRLANELGQTLQSQSLRLLTRLDTELHAQSPYRPDLVTIGLWDGSGSPGPSVMGVRNTAQLAALLKSRRQLVERMALVRATPLVGLLDATGSAGLPDVQNLMNRWRSLIIAVEQHKRGDPASQLMAIERFLLEDVSDMQAQSCANLSDPFADPNDYLATALVMLQESVSERCGDLFGETAARRYEAISNDFMMNLAGRFPFVGDWSDRESVNRAELASPAAVRRFFLDHGDALASVRSDLLLAPLDPQIVASAVRFVDELAAVRQALSPLLDPRPPARPLNYRLRFDFRTDRGFEVGGEQIVDWQLKSGGKALSMRDHNRLLPWVAGAPIALEIRWAKNAPFRPAAGPGRIDDTRLRWQFEGDWGLFQLIAGLLPTSDRSLQLAPGTLAIRVPLEPNPQAAQGAGDDEIDAALIFARMEIGIEIADGEVAAVPLSFFPSLAPRLRDVIPVSTSITGERGTLPLLLPIR